MKIRTYTEPPLLMPEKILFVHDYYQQRGGEDESFEAETRLLEQRGHEVIRYTVHNDSIAQMPTLQVARATMWNQAVHDELRTLIQQEKPALLHCNNTFPLLSPSVYYAAHTEGIPVVQNLRNYRLYCINGLFYRDGKVCEDCLGKAIAWRGIKNKCYRDNRAASTAVASMFAFHRALGTWSDMVDVYVTLTEFARSKFIQAGMSAENIVCKPNFMPTTPKVGKGKGGYALFVGRLSQEKGLDTLLKAWRILDGAMDLKIVGDGPLAEEVAASAASLRGVECLGRQSLRKVYRLMGNASLLIFPSEWYETFGRVAMEAFAKGTPVIAANIGAIAEVVEDGRTGLHFRPGDAEDLARKVRWAMAHPEAWAAMRQTARQTFIDKYTTESNYAALINIYALAARRAGVAHQFKQDSSVHPPAELHPARTAIKRTMAEPPFLAKPHV